MTFKTSFEIEVYKDPAWHIEHSQCEIGEMIQESFGLKVNSFTVIRGGFRKRHSIEIEAFPMQSYLDFKDNLLAYLIDKGIDPNPIKDKFAIIESIGKPAGAEKQSTS